MTKPRKMGNLRLARLARYLVVTKMLTLRFVFYTSGGILIYIKEILASSGNIFSIPKNFSDFLLTRKSYVIEMQYKMRSDYRVCRCEESSCRYQIFKFFFQRFTKYQSKFR